MRENPEINHENSNIRTDGSQKPQVLYWNCYFLTVDIRYSDIDHHPCLSGGLKS